MEDLSEGVYPPAPPMPEPAPAKTSRWRRIDWRPWATGAATGVLAHLTNSGFALTMGALAIVALASQCYGMVEPLRDAHRASQESYWRSQKAADAAWTTYTEARHKLEDQSREYQDLIAKKRAANAEHIEVLRTAQYEAVERIGNIEDAVRARLATSKETWRTAQTVYAITQARRAILLGLQVLDLAVGPDLLDLGAVDAVALSQIPHAQAKETPV